VDRQCTVGEVAARPGGRQRALGLSPIGLVSFLGLVDLDVPESRRRVCRGDTAARRAVVTAAWKASTSAITWSAAKDPMTESGSSRSTSAAASAMAGMELRGVGSTTTSALAPTS
jgi:hypothetical protein